MTARATAEACSNVALIKYWGKRDLPLNLPARGSISVTLGGLKTRTTVAFSDDLAHDTLEVDDVVRPATALGRATRVLDLIRARAGLTQRARIVSHNDFPYGSGLASSASGLAALTLAASVAAGLELSLQELSVIARIGSGSASRSLHGGFVEWLQGERADGSDSCGVLLHPADHWDLRVVVALAGAKEKPVSSTDGMQLTTATSPYQPAWLDCVDPDLDAARAALAARDLERLGRLAEASCMRMHAAMIGADPAILLWRGTTVELIHWVRRQRQAGVPVWFTIDAGPHVKLLTLPEHEDAIAAGVAEVPGVTRVIRSGVGPPARCLPSDAPLESA